MREPRLRCGVLGAGFISEYHILGLRDARVEIPVVFSRRLEQARKRAAQFGIREHTDQYQEVLDRDDIDAVVIATPDDTHEELAVAATRARKAILLQKPMARTSAACRRIIAAAQEADVLLCVGFMHRYFEEVDQFKNLLRGDVIGKALLIRQRNATAGADWAPWFYSRERAGDGVVLQLGIHGIDLLRHLFGKIDAVNALAERMKAERTLADGTRIQSEIPDLAIAMYRLAAGTIAVHEMHYSEIAGTDRFRMEVYGARGTAWLRSERGRLALYAPDYLGHQGWFAPTLPPSAFRKRQHEHFVSMARGEVPADTSAVDGLAGLLVAEAVLRSAARGCWESVEPL